MRALLLKVGATALTLATTAAAAVYVTAHLKNQAAPLQPPVLTSQQGGVVGGVTITPGVRPGDTPPVTSTYAS